MGFHELTIALHFFFVFRSYWWDDGSYNDVPLSGSWFLFLFSMRLRIDHIYNVYKPSSSVIMDIILVCGHRMQSMVWDYICIQSAGYVWDLCFYQSWLIHWYNAVGNRICHSLFLLMANKRMGDSDVFFSFVYNRFSRPNFISKIIFIISALG